MTRRCGPAVRPGGAARAGAPWPRGRPRPAPVATAPVRGYRAGVDPYHLRPPTAPPTPLVVSIPHTGTEVPPKLADRFTDAARALADTDWHLHDLYDFVPALGGTTLHARYSRYVIDLNRPPDAAPLYPGRFETTLVPTTTFAGEALYRDGEAPDDAEVAARRETYWAPYHARLQALLEETVSKFGYALLFDAHSIRSTVPTLFEGRLPDLVLGTADGRSADPAIAEAVAAVHGASGLGHAVNRPFKGGYITRTYGRPARRVHALQLEMAQDLYMDEAPPFPYRPEKAERLRPVLEATLHTYLEAAGRLQR